ncbi:hypothetical protein LVB87_14585 [Lysobacter sp. KIS68-7]|uniref:hypothetical protein n=1 Tax=Lysobacter sp. KIS68-7 TaxID=2904252 RepID=UPI001E64A067|nr:hypothetical protein [Lysobacter sp. KIS68-7]UHQ19395.1 hypothetical protein LVB87_14585 [Lysobacter sp. KIS68-7]
MKSCPAQSAPATTAGTWGLRYSGLVMGQGGKNYVKEFTGMWRLKPDADLAALTAVLAPGGWVNPPGATFSEQMTKLGLIRTARWFVTRTQDFDGYTLVFISQFDGTLEKYFDDFVLNGTENLLAVWGQCVGCPSGAGVTARDVVEYIARGQIKTLACYDVAPQTSIAQIYKAADWYEKTQKFQRAIAKGEAVEDAVNAFLAALAEPSPALASDANIDTNVANEWQYEDVAERVEMTGNAKAAAA